MERNALKPTSSLKLQSRTAVHSAPLWLMKPTEPGRAMPRAKVAFSPVGGLITPRQLGPMIRTPPLRASSSNWRSSCAPCGPSSLKPAEMTIAALTPFSPHSRMTLGITCAGVMMTARSTRSGTELMFG